MKFEWSFITDESVWEEIFFLILIFNFTRLIHNKGIGKASFFVSERVFLGRTKWESHVLNVGGTITNAGILYYLSWRKEGCYWAQTFSWFWILTWSIEMAKDADHTPLTRTAYCVILSLQWYTGALQAFSKNVAFFTNTSSFRVWIQLYLKQPINGSNRMMAYLYPYLHQMHCNTI